MSTVEIVPAFRESYRTPGVPVRDGWHLIVDGEWVQWYATKREAQEAADR